MLVKTALLVLGIGAAAPVADMHLREPRVSVGLVPVEPEMLGDLERAEQILTRTLEVRSQASPSTAWVTVALATP